MKQLVASLIAGAFLLTGSVLAANASTATPTKVTSTAKPASATHHNQKHTAKTKKSSAKASQAKKPGKAHKSTKKASGN